MAEIQTFSQLWPHQVTIQNVDWTVVQYWLWDRADQMGVLSRDLFTSFALSTYAFKDPQLAMEFKLRFG